MSIERRQRHQMIVIGSGMMVMMMMDGGVVVGLVQQQPSLRLHLQLLLIRGKHHTMGNGDGWGDAE